jgi:outer membrane protein assembly factor BamB
MRRFSGFGLILLVVVLSPTLITADDWCVGTGGKPARNGLSGESGPTGPDILWQGGLQAVIAQQAVIEGSVVAMARIQDLGDVLHGTVIVTHDLMTGDTLWTADLPVDFPDSDWRSRVSAIRDGRVYCTRAGNTNESYMYALDAQTGAVLWGSEDLIDEATTEGASFAPNGDLIVGNFHSLIRIDATDGTTVWETQRYSPTTNGSEAAVFGDRAYCWEASPYGPAVVAYDLATGDSLYESHGIGGGYVQQLGLFVGPDGTVYAPRTQNNPVTDSLVAFRDNGSSLEPKWSVTLGYVPFSSYGVGPDGSVYGYTPDYEIVRIDPASGIAIDTSEVISFGFPAKPRMAIDQNGILYVTNGDYGTGALYSFDPDLTLRWSETVINVNLGGPALGANGTLVVCGVGTDLRAYLGGSRIAEGSSPGVPAFDLLVSPNPFRERTEIRWSGADEPVSGDSPKIGIYDASGRLVRAFRGSGDRSVHSVVWNGLDRFGREASKGTYFIRLAAGDVRISRKALLLR